MRNIIGLFLISLLLLFSSCVEDRFLAEGGGPYPELGENEYLFNLRLDDTGVRTRDVDFNPGAALRVNKLWLGIFDITNGSLVAADSTTFGYQTITAGQTAYQFVHLKLEPPTTISADGYIMVCVANHGNVWTPKEDNPTEKMSLAERLKSVTNWSNFIDIAIDTESAYDDPHNLNVPVLAGFVYDDSKQATSHIKINQFKQTLNGKIELSPDQLLNTVKLTVKDGKYYTTDEEGNVNNPMTLVTEGAAIHLRRLVANVNVNIEVRNDNLELERVDYMRYNMPTDVYIIERRTTNCAIKEENGVLVPYSTETEPGYFATGPDGNYNAGYSPNYSDANPSQLYKNDTDWQYGNTTGNKTASFSFQHFANKHWGDRRVFEKETDAEGNTVYKDKSLKQASREELNQKKAFKALVGPDGEPTNFRNYASYFVLKLRLVDKTSGKAVEAHYTIHEGNTSNELGNEVQGGNLQDFVVARNIDYTYNVFVNSYNDIYHNVEVGNAGIHYWGEGGQIFEIDYVTGKTSSYEASTGNFYNVIDIHGGIYENAIEIEAGYPDISFRIYGFTDPEKWGQNFNTNSIQRVATIQGFNYNFGDEAFYDLNGLWPPSSMTYSHYILALDKMGDNSQNTINLEQIPPDLREGLLFLPAIDTDYPINSDDLEEKKAYFEAPGHGMGIVEFITKFYEQVDGITRVKYQPTQLKFHIYIKESNIRDKQYLDRNRYLRAFYIADRNGIVDNVDGCTKLMKIATAVQYPDELSGQSFEMKGAVDSNMINHEGGSIDVTNNVQGFAYGMIFSNTPDLAFRLLGYDGNSDDYYDYCYNFNLSDYPEFENYWPANSNPTLISKEELSSFDIKESLLNGFSVRLNNSDYNIKSFISEYEGSLSNMVPTGFKAGTYGKKAVGNQRSSMRALYVFDKNAFKGDIMKADNIAHYQIYCIEQLPEEIPPTQLEWKGDLPSISIEKYNVIDPFETFEIAVPILNYVDKNGIHVGEGDYNFVLTIGNRDFSSYGEWIGSNMVYRIPQSALKGRGGDVFVQAITNSPYFTDSAKELIGNINLKNHAIWKKGDKEDWDNALSYYSNGNNKFTSHKCDYLNLVSNGSDRGFNVNSNDHLESGGGAAYIEFKVYQDCQIKVNAWHNGTRQVALFLDGVDTTIASGNIPTSYNSTWFYSFDILDVGPEGVLVSLRPKNGGLKYSSIEIIPK